MSGGGGSHEFEKTCLLSPICFSIRRFMNWIGALLATIGAALDFIYIWKAPYYSSYIYLSMSLLWTLRVLTTICAASYYVKRWIIDYKPAMSAGIQEDKEDDDTDEKGRGSSEDEEESRS